MKTRRALAAFGLLLSASALAGSWTVGTPKIHRPVQAASGSTALVRPTALSVGRAPVRARATAPPRVLSISGPVAAMQARDCDGWVWEIPVADGLDLGGALPVPEGCWAELELELAGPVSASSGGRVLRVVDLEGITVVLDDPEGAGEVVLDLGEIGELGELEAVLRGGVVGVGG